MSSKELQGFNEVDIKVTSKYLSSERNSFQEIVLKIFVSNESTYEITNLQILITSLPPEVKLLSKKKFTFLKLIPNSSITANFNIDASQSRNGGYIESVATYYDPKEIMHTISIESFKII